MKKKETPEEYQARHLRLGINVGSDDVPTSPTDEHAEGECEVCGAMTTNLYCGCPVCWDCIEEAEEEEEVQ